MTAAGSPSRGISPACVTAPSQLREELELVCLKIFDGELKVRQLDPDPEVVNAVECCQPGANEVRLIEQEAGSIAEGEPFCPSAVRVVPQDSLRVYPTRCLAVPDQHAGPPEMSRQTSSPSSNLSVSIV